MKTTIEQEYLDFCGNTSPDLSKVDSNKALALAELMNNSQDTGFYNIITTLYQANYDELALAACFCLSQGIITRNQTATVLEFVEMQAYEVIPIFLSETAVLQIYENLLGKEKCSQFLALLNTLPFSQRFIFQVKIDPIAFTEKHQEFLELLKHYKIITYVFDAPALLAVEAREALNLMRFSESAKKLLPTLGTFSIDKINDAVYKKSRPSALQCPGVVGAKKFHGLEALPLLNSLHDGFHLEAMCSIPNKAYEAYLYAIEMVRKKTGQRWSRELWNAVDMEIDYFLIYPPENSVTKNFQMLLHAHILSKGTWIGLFNQSPCIDTTWLLLIDMVLDAKTWHALGINFKELRSIYKDMSDCIIRCQSLLAQETSPAKQVAIVKSSYFNLPLAATDNVHFIKRKSNDNYLEVEVDNLPILFHKKTTLMLNYYAAEIAGLIIKGKVSLGKVNEISRNAKGLSAIDISDSIHDSIPIIPNQNKLAFQCAIDLLIEKTGFEESMELKQYNENCKNPSYEEDHATVLFPPSAFVDTTWILLIHIALYTDYWRTKGVAPEDFNEGHKQLYDHIIRNPIYINKEEPFAKQVALIKASFLKNLGLEIKYSAKGSINFTLGRYGYFEVHMNNQPMIIDKYTWLKLGDAFSVKLLEKRKSCKVKPEDIYAVVTHTNTLPAVDLCNAVIKKAEERQRALEQNFGPGFFKFATPGKQDSSTTMPLKTETLGLR